MPDKIETPEPAPLPPLVAAFQAMVDPMPTPPNVALPTGDDVVLRHAHRYWWALAKAWRRNCGDTAPLTASVLGVVSLLHVPLKNADKPTDVAVFWSPGNNRWLLLGPVDEASGERFVLSLPPCGNDYVYDKADDVTRAMITLMSIGAVCNDGSGGPRSTTLRMIPTTDDDYVDWVYSASPTVTLVEGGTLHGVVRGTMNQPIALCDNAFAVARMAAKASLDDPMVLVEVHVDPVEDMSGDARAWGEGPTFRIL